jgi:hypothetical protein
MEPANLSHPVWTFEEHNAESTHNVKKAIGSHHPMQSLLKKRTDHDLFPIKQKNPYICSNASIDAIWKSGYMDVKFSGWHTLGLKCVIKTIMTQTFCAISDPKGMLISSPQAFPCCLRGNDGS